MSRTAKRTLLIGGGLVGVALLGAAAVTTRGEPGRSVASTAGGSVDAPYVDPDAVAALDRMGAYLRTLKTIQVQANVTTEEVAADGQKVQSTSVVDLLAERPNHLRAKVANERQPRVFYYDGKQFTLWAPRPQFYAQVAAPSTIGALADELDAKYDIQLPLVDLFRWGTPESGLKDLTSAIDLGPSVVEGTNCERYLFRQNGLDWQLWIQSGEFPLPRKLVLTTTSDEARPQHTAIWTWNLAPSVSPEEFSFVAPAGAKRISFAAAEKTRDVATRGSK
jgi:hypothetical protein